MDILFKDNALRRLCTQERVMLRALGKKGARKLRARLKDLQAFSNMKEVCFGRPHPLRGHFKECLGLDLDGGRRLVLEAANEPIPRNEDHSIDWSSVTRVRVIFIGDYHD